MPSISARAMILPLAAENVAVFLYPRASPAGAFTAGTAQHFVTLRARCPQGAV